LNIHSSLNFDSISQIIIDAGIFLDGRGWTPAHSGSVSHRLPGKYCAITVSDKHKGRLTRNDVTIVDFHGRPQDNRKPAAQTVLHTSLYARNLEINTVLHTNSVNSTILSLLIEDAYWDLEGYELQKALTGISSHQNRIRFPIFDNTQDVDHLAHRVNIYLRQGIPCWGYLVRGHGLYTWGKSMENALKHLEAIEYLIQCQLEMIKIQGKRSL